MAWRQGSTKVQSSHRHWSSVTLVPSNSVEVESAAIADVNGESRELTTLLAEIKPTITDGVTD